MPTRRVSEMRGVEWVCSILSLIRYRSGKLVSFLRVCLQGEYWEAVKMQRKKCWFRHYWEGFECYLIKGG